MLCSYRHRFQAARSHVGHRAASIEAFAFAVGKVAWPRFVQSAPDRKIRFVDTSSWRWIETHGLLLDS
jgi:hypothetical protein